MSSRSLTLLLALGLLGSPLAAQSPDSLPTRPATPTAALRPGSPLTNAGVVRATAQVDSVFVSRLVDSMTIDGGDFVASLLARIGAPRFNDSAGFRVTVDSNLARIRGRLQDFSPEKRRELGALFSFLDSTTVWVAEVAMLQHDQGLMRFRLERMLVGGIPVPEMLLAPVLTLYGANYPELSGGGREFLVAMPERARAELLQDRIRLVIGTDR